MRWCATRRGAKMSKSKGNVIDPLALIDEYGADALALHARRHGGAGPRHQALDAARRRLSQFRDQAVERRALCRDEWLRHASPKFDPKSAKETLNRWIAHETAKAAAEVTEAIEAYRFNDAADRGLPLRLEYLLRLVSGAREAAADRAGRRRQERNAGDGRLGAGRDPQAAASVHAVHHRRIVGPVTRASTTRCWRSTHGRARRALPTTRPKPKSAGSSISSPRSVRCAPR